MTPDAKVWLRFMAGMFSEPLTAGELADLFGCSRNRVRDLVLPFVEHQDCGGRWRVKLADLPPAYLLREMHAAEMHQVALSCTAGLTDAAASSGAA